MNLDDAKENIQPLARGRNISSLEKAISAESQESVQQQLADERRACEEAIRTYAGDDPLAPWFEYVLWVEQNCPRSGKESALDEVIQQCLVKFDEDERYRQDERMVQLYIKYIDGQPNPAEHFHTLWLSGIGTRCASLYICWAYYHDLADAFAKAEEVYQRGRDAHAEPRDQLELAHRQFGFSMSQRMLHKDTYRQEFLSSMEERRSALTSLRAHRHGHGRAAATKVGSMRTGAAVRSALPGRVGQQPHGAGPSSSSSRNNAPIAVYQENQPPGAAGRMAPPAPAAAAPPRSVVQTIMDSSRRQENLREAGPWSQAGHSKQPLYDPRRTATAASEPQFAICEDNQPIDMDYTRAPIELEPIEGGGGDAHDLGIRLFPNHVRHNMAQRPFPVDEIIEEEVRADVYPAYNKCLLYPRPTYSYSIEELAAWRWFVRRGVQNKFRVAHDAVWGPEAEGIREYPLFQRKNDADAEEWYVQRFVEDAGAKQGEIILPMAEIYPPAEESVERSMEELLAAKWRRGELPDVPGTEEAEVEEEEAEANAMDVTIAVKGRQSIYGGAVRKSIAPGGRKSLRPGTTATHPEENRRRPTAAADKFSAIGEDEEMQEEGEPASSIRPPIPSVFKPAIPTAAQQQLSEPTPPKQRVLFDMAAAPALPKLTGPIRKSVVPAAQRAQQQHRPAVGFAMDESPETVVVARPEPKLLKPVADEIEEEEPVRTVEFFEEEEPVPTAEVVEIAAAPKPPTFAIFEDTIAGADVPKAPAAIPELELFKQPLAPSGLGLAGRRPLAARSRSPVDGGGDAAAAGDQTAFMPNDSCSTQQFNFFIKAQSISTPKRTGPPGGRAAAAACELSPVQEAANVAAALAQGRAPAPSASPVVVSSAEQSPEFGQSGAGHSAAGAGAGAGDQGVSPAGAGAGAVGQRQLSTIMETTEGTHLNSTSSDRDSDSGSHPRNATVGTSMAAGAAAFRQQYRQPSPVVQPQQKQSQMVQKEQQQQQHSYQQPAIENQPMSQYGQSLAATAPAEIVSQCPLQLYEDRTETLPIRRRSSIYKAPSEATVDLTLAAAAPPPPPPLDMLEIYQDPTDQMPIIPAAAAATFGGALPLAPKVLADRLPQHEQPDVSLMPPAPAVLADESLAALGRRSGGFPLPPSLSMAAAPVAARPAPASAPTIAVAVDDDDDYLDMFTRTPPGKSVSKPQAPAPMRSFALASPPKMAAPMAAMPSRADVSEFLLEPMSPTPQLTRSTLPSAAHQQSTHQLHSIHIKEEPLDHSAAAVAQHSAAQLADAKALRIARVAAAVDYSFNLSAVDITDEPSVDLSAAVAAAKEAQRPPPVAIAPVATAAPPVAATSRLPFGLHPASAATAAPAPSARPSMASVCAFEADESIYVPRPIVPRRASAEAQAEEEELADVDPAAEFVQPDIDMNATRQVIQTHLVDGNADPFDERVQQAFLEQCDFYDYLRNLPACQMQQHVRPLQVRQQVPIAGREFVVERMLGQGVFGQVFAARCTRTGTTMALKQQRPASLWEYYICLEIESRIDVPHMMQAYMRIDAALIANNGGILVSECSPYGSLLAVCNKVKAATGKNMAEPVVMMLARQLLAAIDHLHGCKIIHADIKPDNILLMRRLAYDDSDEMCLQLIDFGQAIDLQLYPDGQTFRAQLSTKNFVCVEMLEQRAWLHQTDLFCAASTIHTMLFGTYMNVRKTAAFGWQITTSVPRYFCKLVWESLFRTLINVKDCWQMPNLQMLRVTLLEEVRGDRERMTRDAIVAFNRALE